MRITSKGQVTIPIDVREKAGLLPHTEVEFELRRGVVILRKARAKSATASGRGRPSRGERLVRHMTGRATRRLTTDQILALTRGE